MRGNAGQRKPVYWHILRSAKIKDKNVKKKHIKNCHPHHWLGYRDRIHLLIHCYHLKLFPQHFLEKLYLPIVFSQYHTSRFHYNLTL